MGSESKRYDRRVVRRERALFGQLVSRDGVNGIRPLHPVRDLDGLAQLIEQAFGKELSEGGEQVLRELRLLARLGPLSLLATGMGSEIDGLFNGFVWEQEGRVVGNVTLSRPTGHPNRWQISNVAVLESFRGRGIGRRLVEAAIDLILQRGGNTAYLFVRHDNPAAIHLYESLGFAEVDRTTDCKYVPDRPAEGDLSLRLLRRLQPWDAEALYELASLAMGAGRRWLTPVRRHHFVRPADERFLRGIGSLFSAERETTWGAFATDGRLRAGLSLRARRLWNPRPHYLALWVHPGCRGQVEDALAQDVVALVREQPHRPAQVSLPACEEAAVDALLRQGFVEVRTLILMKLDL
jgi:ribosomal protein S18 acetylase RimI-like enzyme